MEGRANKFKGRQISLIKNENLAPTYWAMGRVIETKTSADGCVRVAKIKVGGGQLERPIQKLVVLPVDDDIDNYK